jgi:hypothetical protein
VCRERPSGRSRRHGRVGKSETHSDVGPISRLASKFPSSVNSMSTLVLLPARLIIGEKNLKLIPLGVVPQRDRRPRTISDYSFFGVNDETIPLSPSEAVQFWRALQRILQAITCADPSLSPVYLSKIDIADCFLPNWSPGPGYPQAWGLIPGARRRGEIDRLPAPVAHGLVTVTINIYRGHGNSH